MGIRGYWFQHPRGVYVDACGQKNGLTVGSATMLLLTMISTVLIGLLFFKEQITKGQEVGVALGVIAAVFLLNIIKIP
jgi:drug/metabolite transporter (DMT)-like permease